MAELLLSGCTTASDHHYVFPNDVRLEDEIRAAQDMGIRFHAARGSMSLGEGHGGLPPDHLVEREPDILRDTQRLIETWHDPSPQSMLRIVVAPCSPFSVTVDLMRESAALARAYGLQMHTHLAETDADVAYSVERFGMRPGAYAEDMGWLATMFGTPIASNWTLMKSLSSGEPAPASATARRRICAWPRASRRFEICSMSGSRWAWASMAPPLTTVVIFWAKRGKPCY